MPDFRPELTDRGDCLVASEDAPTLDGADYLRVARLKTHSVHVNIPPRDSETLFEYLTLTTNSLEAAGYRIINHSLMDKGGGWLLSLTIGWYE